MITWVRNLFKKNKEDLISKYELEIKDLKLANEILYERVNSLLIEIERLIAKLEKLEEENSLLNTWLKGSKETKEDEVKTEVNKENDNKTTRVKSKSKSNS
jgi:hypothetical protein